MHKGLDLALLDHLVSTRLFEPAGTVLLAVSGGLDSVALLDLMFCIKEDLGSDLAVAHVIHGISEEATAAAPEVQKLAHSYRVPFFMEELELGAGATETVARQARYHALRSIQRDVGADYLATAHHLDDQAETVLFRFLRGSGIAGLVGIPARGPDGLARPLLPFRRSELENWLAMRFPDPSARPAIFQDPANADVRHDRSWLRHNLLPSLRQRFGSDFDQRLADVAVHAGDERGAWAALLRTLPELDFCLESDASEVAREPLGRYDKLLSQTILRALAREVECRLSRSQTQLLLEFATGSSSGRSMELGSGFQATLVFDRLRIGRVARAASPETVCLELDECSEGHLEWGRWLFRWCPEEAGVCSRDSETTWITYGTCEVKGPGEGDRIRPLGGVGARKLRRVLMDARIPAAERDRFPIVYRGPDAVWAPGICRSDVAIPDVGQAAVRLEARAS